MKYVSTRGHAASQSFTDILLEGLGPDGGLMVPEEWPRIMPSKLAAMLTQATGTGQPSAGRSAWPRPAERHIDAAIKRIEALESIPAPVVRIRLEELL